MGGGPITRVTETAAATWSLKTRHTLGVQKTLSKLAKSWQSRVAIVILVGRAFPCSNMTTIGPCRECRAHDAKTWRDCAQCIRGTVMRHTFRCWITRYSCIGLSILAGYSAGFNPIPARSANVLNDSQVSTPNPNSTGVVAVSCDTFLSSLGVNTHVDQGYNPTAYVAPLQYLGIRNIRDGVRNIGSSIMLHHRTGIRVNLVGNDVGALIYAAKTLAAAAALLSIEGPNEPNNFPGHLQWATGRRDLELGSSRSASKGSLQRGKKRPGIERVSGSPRIRRRGRDRQRGSAVPDHSQGSWNLVGGRHAVCRLCQPTQLRQW